MLRLVAVPLFLSPSLNVAARAARVFASSSGVDAPDVRHDCVEARFHCEACGWQWIETADFSNEHIARRRAGTHGRELAVIALLAPTQRFGYSSWLRACALISGGRYDLWKNNCQHYARRLWDSLVPR